VRAHRDRKPKPHLALLQWRVASTVRSGVPWQIDEEFGAALMTAAAVFAFKMSFIHLLVSRSRITTDITQYGFNPIMKIFQPVLLAYPSFGTVSSEALERIEKNNSDNEPFFLLVMGTPRSSRQHRAVAIAPVCRPRSHRWS
jgi:hypothetical protein